MKKPTAKQRVQRLLESDPKTWPKAISNLGAATRLEVEGEAGLLAQRAALLAEYVSHRAAYSGHCFAAKKANSLLRKVRRTMGYAIPSCLPTVVPYE